MTYHKHLLQNLQVIESDFPALFLDVAGMLKCVYKVRKQQL